MQNIVHNNIHRKVEDGLDFVLNHFQEPLFPRKIMTKELGYQAEIFNKKEALGAFKISNYEDCRINAYPYIVDNRHQIITFVMLDFDLNTFKYSRQKLERALNKILSSLNIKPTVIWSGNGYHVLVPMNHYLLF